jgi:secreted trypsin-like serine protease
VLLGSINVGIPSAGFVKATVTQAIKHESYSAATGANDIALLKLSAPVALTGLIGDKLIN